MVCPCINTENYLRLPTKGRDFGFQSTLLFIFKHVHQQKNVELNHTCAIRVTINAVCKNKRKPHNDRQKDIN